MTLNSPVGNRAADGPATSSAAPASLTLALTPARPFAVCPVDRPRSYVDDFGDPRWFGGFHRHQGIDILAPWGTPVRAPFDGTASRSTSWAGGLTVKIEGRLGFVYDAHLSRTGRMGKVRAGDVVGYVGNSGDARGGSTHDHFEWHPGAGAAVDSFRYLNAVCKASAWRPMHHRWLIL